MKLEEATWENPYIKFQGDSRLKYSKNEIEWSKMSLLIGPDEIQTIPEKVDNLINTGEYLDMIEYGHQMYQKHLTWDGCLNTIAKRIQNAD